MQERPNAGARRQADRRHHAGPDAEPRRQRPAGGPASRASRKGARPTGRDTAPARKRAPCTAAPTSRLSGLIGRALASGPALPEPVRCGPQAPGATAGVAPPGAGPGARGCRHTDTHPKLLYGILGCRVSRNISDNPRARAWIGLVARRNAINANLVFKCKRWSGRPSRRHRDVPCWQSGMENAGHPPHGGPDILAGRPATPYWRGRDPGI